MEQVNKQPTWQTHTPFFQRLVKNKYFKIMQTRATLDLLTSMHMDYLQIEKYRLAVLFFFFFFYVFLLFPPLKCLCPFTISPPIFSHLTRLSPNIADMARTIKAVLKTSSHLWKNKKMSNSKWKRFTSRKK